MPSPWPCQHQDVPVRVADEQVEVAVVPEVGDGQPGGVEAGVVDVGGGEAPLAVAKVDAHRVVAEHGDVGDPVVIEVGDADNPGGSLGREGDGVGEAARS